MTWCLDASDVGLMKAECLVLSYRDTRIRFGLQPASLPLWCTGGTSGETLESRTAALDVCIIPRNLSPCFQLAQM